MSDEHLRRLLERAGDDRRAQADARAWPVIREAYERQRAERRANRTPRLVAVLATTAAAFALVAFAVTSPGAAVADWVREQIAGKVGLERSAPALTHLPGGGRMLVSSPKGVWVVSADGSRRLLRGYRGATWSPRGLYVGAWRGHELFAIEPGGRVHWSLARRGTISAADWSPDGYRIAYLSGHALRVVAGDGSGDKRVRSRVAPVAPAWKPVGPHLLAYAVRSRVVEVVAADPRVVAWRHELSVVVKALSWSPDGRLLAVAGRGGVTILDGAHGRVRRQIDAPRGFAVAGIAFSHTGRRLAISVNSRDGRARALAVDLADRNTQPRRLFAGSGRFDAIQWSPDDRWVLISWPAADQWLFLRSAQVKGVSAVRDIASQFDPATRRATFPALSDWCCG
jgi:WD40 repeat protein